jgi:hypothetical protein
MLKIITVCFCFLTINSIGQNTLSVGQGILKINFSKPLTLDFFSDTTQLKSTKTISIIKGADQEFKIKNSNQVMTWFQPEALHLDYDIFILRVDTIIGKWYKVVTNTDKAIIMWTKADSFKKYFKWSTFLTKEVTNITKNKTELEIKTEPKENSKTIKKIEKSDCFEVLDVKGDWIKIRTHTILECSDSKHPVKSGWLRWKDKNKLTIAFGLTC